MPRLKVKTIAANDLQGDPYGISTFEGYSTIPLTNGSNPSLLVVNDEDDEQYILGFVKKADLVTELKQVKQLYYEGWGEIQNDLYNGFDDPLVRSMATKRSRETTKAKTIYLGDNFVSGSDGYEGFDSQYYLYTDRVNSGASPLAIDTLGEAYLVMADGGGKFYLSTSGTVMEAEAYKLNIGTRITQMDSHGVWTPATLKTQTVEDKLFDLVGSGTKVGYRDSFPLPNTYHVHNIEDDAGLFMGSGTVEVYNWGASDTEFSHTIWDDLGVHIDVDAARKINISVGGVAGTSIIIEDGKITLLATDFEWDGNLHVTGTLTVDMLSTFEAAVDAKAAVDIAGKLTGIGGSDLS